MAAAKKKKPMNRAKLNEAVAAELGESKANADRIVGVVLSNIQKGVKQEGGVTIVGFGSFELKQRAARKGVNPRTGEQITIKASKTVGFRPGKALKESL